MAKITGIVITLTMTILLVGRLKLVSVRNVDGAQAVSLFMDDQDKYDLILMDIHMPQMDGYEATKTFRAVGTEKARTIPIFAMTATVLEEDVAHCLACGMNDHLAKPVDWKLLIKKILKYLP